MDFENFSADKRRDAPAVNEVQNPPTRAGRDKRSPFSESSGFLGNRTTTAPFYRIGAGSACSGAAEDAVVKRDGRNLLASSELRRSRKQAQALDAGHCHKLDREREISSQKGVVVPIRDMAEEFIWDKTPYNVENKGVHNNYGSIGTINVGVTNVRLKGRCVPSKWLQNLVHVQRVVDEEFIAEASVANTNTQLSKEQWEVRDARRVAAGQCGFYKFCKMLAEGKLSQYDQNGYWTSIARRPKHQVLKFFETSTGVAMFNLTEHMRRCVAISLDRRKNLFDASSRQEVIHFIKYLRGSPDYRLTAPVVAQMGFLPNIFTHRVEVGLDPQILSLLQGSEFDGLSKFLTSTVVLCGALVTTPSIVGRICAFVQYLVGFDATRNVVMTVVRRAPQLSQAFLHPTVAQAKTDAHPAIFQALDALEAEGETIWVALASVLASTFQVEVPRETWKNAARAKRFANISTVITSVDKMISVVHKVIELAKEGIQAFMHGMSISQWRLTGISASLPRYAARVAQFYEQCGPIGVRQDQDAAKLAVDLFREGSRYMECVSGGGASHGQFAAFQSVWKMVMEMYQAAQDYFLTHTERQPPFVIHFIGPTGIGKSRLSQHIIGDLCFKVGVKYDKAFDHYFRNARSPYWEGYTYQKVVFYDDFLQNPDIRSQECDEIIRIVNNAPYLLNMAQADLKGKTLFSSPFVLLSSNVDIPEDIRVADVAAVRRRRDIVVKVRVKDDYRDDHGAVRLGALPDLGRTFHRDIYSFYVCDARTGTELTTFETYHELLSYIVGEYSQKHPMNERRNSVLGQLPSGQFTEQELRNEPTYPLLSNLKVMVPDWLRIDPILQMFYKRERLENILDDVSSTPSSQTSIDMDEELERMEALTEHTGNVGRDPPLNELQRSVLAPARTANLRERIRVLEEYLRTEIDFSRNERDSEWRATMIDAARVWYEDYYMVPATDETLTSLLRVLVLQEFRETFSGTLNAWLSWLSYIRRVHHGMSIFPRKPKVIDFNKATTLKQIEWALGIIVVALSVTSLVRYFRKSSEPAEQKENFQIESGAFASGDERTRSLRKRIEIRSLKELQTAQSSKDPRALDLIKTKFASAMCLVRFIKEDGVVGVHGLLIGGKLIAAPYHLFATTPEACEIEIVTTTSTFRYGADEIVVRTDWDYADLLVIVMPNHFPSYPKLVHHFVEQRDLTRYHLGDVAMLHLLPNDNYAIPYFQLVRNVFRKGEHEYVAYGDRTEKIHIIDSLRYQAETRFGDCGAPLIWFHPSVSRKILGFHVAGGEHTGASNILTKELMTQVFATISTTQIDTPELDDGVPTLRDGVADIGQMGYLGLIPEGKQFRQPTVSEIKPSLVHGKFPVITKPAALTPKDGISPLELGVRKGCAVNCILPLGDLETVLDQIYDHYVDVMDDIRPRVLSLDEALNGVPGDPWIKPLNMTTSPGYPYIHERDQPGKLSFVYQDDSGWHASDRLRRDVESRIQLAAKRIIPETVFVDVLKDERRELEKVEALKTRIFNTCPMDLNIAVRMYFGHLATLTMSNHIEKEIAVGINVHSDSWRSLWKRLRSNGPNWLAGDYSNYDKTFPRQLMVMVAHLANRFYSDGNDVIRETLMETMCNRVHLANRVVYFQTHGNPSGNVLTTIINSFGNMALMRLAWICLARQYDPRVELEFEDHVSLSVYGDDNVATVSNYASWFNMRNISRSLAQFGVTYTPPKVGDSEYDCFLPEDKVTYLKRYFRKRNGLIFAPLPKERIRETCNWIRKCADEREATIENMFMAQLEMFHWGKEEYDKFVEELLTICRQEGLQPRTVPWSYFFIKFQEGDLLGAPTLEDLADSAPNYRSAPEVGEALVSPRPGRSQYQQMVAQSQNVKDNKTAPINKRPTFRVGADTNVRNGLLGKASTNTSINIGPIIKEQPQKAQAGRVTQQSRSSRRNQKASGRTTTPKAKNTTGNTSVPKSATPLVAMLPTRQFETAKQGKTFNMKGRELLTRIDGPQVMQVIPLLPGITGATKLDNMAKQYAWASWNSNIVLEYKSLLSVANDGVWYYQVVHDASNQDITTKVDWNVASKAFTAQRACIDFKVTIPRSALTNGKLSPNMTERHSWILCIYKGEVPPCGEFWISYDVGMGGVSASVQPSTRYKVEKGVFMDPLTGKPIDGIPLAADGKGTTYKFDSLPLNRKQTEEFVALSGGTPTLIERGDQTSPVVNDTSTVDSVTIQNPPQTKMQRAQSVVESVASGVEILKDVAPAIKHIGIKVGKGARWTKRKLQAWKKKGSGKANEPEDEDFVEILGPFSNYTGYVTVGSASQAFHETESLSSITPLFVENSTKGVRFAFLPFLGSLVGSFAVSAIPEVVGAIINKVANQKKVVHKRADALSFVYDRDPQGSAGPGGGGDDDDDDESGGNQNGGIIDPEEPENPLPDIPDFDDDIEAPSKEFVPWVTTNRHFGGFVIDNNGTPIVKWLGGTYCKRGLHMSVPTPKYYTNDRMPWDRETKRKLGCYVELDRAVKDMYLLAHTINWGDDSAGSWCRSIPGSVYMGTVARFGGISDSRSVIKITDPDEWNKAPIQFMIGQAKDKYFKKDEGRACLFWCSLGAVDDVRIAKNFLKSFDTSGNNAMVNIYTENKGSDKKSGYFSSESDVVLKSRSTDLPIYVEPSCPGFRKNQQAVFDANNAARMTGQLVKEKLPIAIEAGPIRGFFLARYDEANGWYQHVPVCAQSYTSLSGRWSQKWLLGDENTEGALISASSDGNDSFCMRVARVTPPSVLLPDAYVCLEINCVGGVNGLACAPYPSGTQKVSIASGFSSTWDCTISTPMTNRRFMFPAAEFDIAICGDTSRPTTAVAGYDKDIYVSFSYTAYLLKDKTAGIQWVYHDQDWAGLDGDAYKRPSYPKEGEEGKWMYYMSNHILLYEMSQSGTSGSWLPTTKTWSSDSSLPWKTAGAPLSANCPLFKNSRMLTDVKRYTPLVHGGEDAENVTIEAVTEEHQQRDDE